MDTNKIYAEAIVNDYSEKKESKVMALKKLDIKAKLSANIFASECWQSSMLFSFFLICIIMNIREKFLF